MPGRLGPGGRRIYRKQAQLPARIVTGTDPILDKYGLPCVPMIHCFPTDDDRRVDMTEGNANGKNRSIEDFLDTETVMPNISAKDEYLKYRNALKENILKRTDLRGIDIKTILRAREKGLDLLKANLER
ncbi:MAG: hypothetical protein KFF68_02040 [Desulfosarcina sp.]|nr:hypothetical protein [Desulfosarcina sp.]